MQEKHEQQQRPARLGTSDSKPPRVQLEETLAGFTFVSHPVLVPFLFHLDHVKVNQTVGGHHHHLLHHFQ